MIELIKKSILAGIGATVITKERLERNLHEFVETGKISSSEAQRMVEQILAEGKKEIDQSKSGLNKNLEEFLHRANLATKHDLATLETRIRRLEQKASSSPQTKTKTAKTKRSKAKTASR